jgi:hypothetical protein
MNLYYHNILSYYSILIGRLAATEGIPELHWIEALLPVHLPHMYNEYMDIQTKCHPLPIMHKNEVKHEDCLDILDGYEELLIDIHTEAFGMYIYR